MDSSPAPRVPARGRGAALAAAAPSAQPPAALTSFIGRDAAVAEIRRLLAGLRLLTITGAGGSGKTRLALEVAACASKEGEGVAWVELAPLADPELVPQQVAAALGLKEEGGASALDVLHAALREREVLLVLDNCEHVVEACASFAELLLRAAPRLRILATSREPLGVAGERAWLIPALSLPERDAQEGGTGRAKLEGIERSEAVRLFVERARDVMPSFDLTDANAGAVAQICRRLDGLPLAIELAAARVRVLPPEQLASRLDSAFHALGSGSRGAMPRHRTLRAVMDWSHALLSEPERLLLRRLSVFAGGFTLEAAEDVCSADSLRADDVLDLVAALVDRSLVLMRESGGRARYHLLETVRQYAAARLLEAGEEHDLGRRHAEHFIALADEAEPHLTTTGRRIWFERLTEEADNLRQGLAWTRDHAPAQHVRLAGLLCWFWFSSREWLEGRRWLEGAMAMTEAAPGTRVRAQVLFAAGVLATLQAQTALAEPWLEESAATAEAIGDRRLEAYARNYLGLSLVQRGRPEGEIPIRAALWWLREAGDLYGMRLSYLLLASLGMARGELEVAMEDAAEGVRIARLFGQDRELGIALQVLGSVQLMRGDLPAARATLRESLAALHRDPMYLFLARGLDTLARVGFARGEWGEGVRLSGAAAAIRTTIGAEAFALDRASLDEHLAAARAALGEEAFERARAEGGALGLDGAITHALAESARVAEGSDPAARSAAEAGRAEAPAPVVAPDVPPAAGGPGAAGAPTAATSRRDVADPGSAESVSEDRGPAAGHGVGDGIDVRALGPLHITRGARAEAIEWAYARPRELFLYLLSHPEGRTREQIGVVFWPEASAAQVKNSFHVTLHHLRRSLGGADCVLFEDERYRISPAMDVRFDVRTFEDGVAAALRRARSDEPLDALRDALTLYRGHFLSAAGAGDWHLEIHDRLVRLAIDGHVALGGMLVGREEWREAAGVYERLLRIDDLNEEAARGLMLCLARTGQRARALQQYERFVDRLREEIGAEPEPDSTRLAESIRLGASLQAP